MDFYERSIIIKGNCRRNGRWGCDIRFDERDKIAKKKDEIVNYEGGKIGFGYGFGNQRYVWIKKAFAQAKALILIL